MRSKGNFILYYFILVIGNYSCSKPPELPIEPKINFEEVSFIETSGPDSLIVTIYFEDGDGDLGLGSDEVDPPYHPYDVVLDDSGDTVKYGSHPDLPEYNPIDYIIVRDDEGEATDTILVEINENHYNYFVRFYRKINGSYLEFDWRQPPYYQTFDGRFPILNTQGGERPLEGSLRYGMVSSGWLLLFRDSLKISVQIQDRNLHKSNIVESEDFTLDMIRRQD